MAESRRRRVWIFLGLMAAAIAIVVVRARLRKEARGPTAADDHAHPGAPRFNKAPSAPPEPEVDTSSKEFVDGVMNAWHTAILQRHTEGVEEASGTFRSHPQRFLAPLSESARTHENERVRAFSTRMLGMMALPEAAPVFIDRLDDPSRYVRGNAAWGLGELAKRPASRDRARPAADKLRKMKSTDPAEEVRNNAAEALKQM